MQAMIDVNSSEPIPMKLSHGMQQYGGIQPAAESHANGRAGPQGQTIELLMKFGRCKHARPFSHCYPTL